MISARSGGDAPLFSRSTMPRFRDHVRQRLSQSRGLLWLLAIFGVVFAGIEIASSTDELHSRAGALGLLRVVVGITVVSAGLPLVFLVVVAAVDTVQTRAKRPDDPSTWGPWRRWYEANVTEERVFAVAWILSGPACAAISLMSYFGTAPRFATEESWILPAVTSFALLWFAWMLGGAEYSVFEQTVESRGPADSLSAGQFVLVFAGLSALGVLSSVFFGGLLVALDALRSATDAVGSPVWHALLPWIAWIVCGIGIVYTAVILPGTMLVRWLAQRRALDKIRTDALVTLAEAARYAAKERSHE